MCFVVGLRSRKDLQQDLLIHVSMRLGDDNGKELARDYCTGTPNASSSAAQTENPQQYFSRCCNKLVQSSCNFHFSLIIQGNNQ